MDASRHLDEVDPSALIAREAERLAHLLGTRADDDAWWHQESRCPGWSMHDVLAHLAANEVYHRACREGTVAQLVQEGVAAGMRSADDFNQRGIDERRDTSASALVCTWVEEIGHTSGALRERGDGEVDSSVGPYPARLQAAHIAIEVATHADDMLEGPDADDPARWAWRAQLSRFLLEEHDADLRAEPAADGTHTWGEGMDVTLDDRTFTDAVIGRLRTGALRVEVAAALDISK